jgi:uncharacterized membrane protein
MPFLQFVATICAALFAGASVYINVAEHPARMTLDTEVAASQWAPSYKRATWLQAPLAGISFVAAALAFLLGAGLAWLVGALLIGAVIPFTLVVIMPTNRKLLEPGCDRSSPEMRSLLETWARLHAVRTVLSLLAAALFVMSLVTTVP